MRARRGGAEPRGRAHLAALAACAALLSSCFDNSSAPARESSPAEEPRYAQAGPARPAAPGADAATRWREALELDLAPEVAAEARVAIGAPETSVELRALAALVLAQAGAARPALDACGGDAPPLRLARARILLEQYDDPAGAVACLVAADGRPREADAPEALYVAGRALARAGDCRGAAPFLLEGLRLAPHANDAAAARAVLFACALQGGARDEATRLERAARSSAQWQATLKARRLQARARPEEPLPKVGIAELWLSVDEPRRALDALNAHLAREDARTDARFHALRGECLRRVGERAAAAEALARARGMSPDDPETAYFEAQLARDAGERELALAALRRACDASAAREGRLLRAQLELARWLLQDGRLDEARARHARYLELGGEEPLEAR
jgi:uncharacterized protein (DUF2237 family)